MMIFFFFSCQKYFFFPTLHLFFKQAAIRRMVFVTYLPFLHRFLDSFCYLWIRTVSVYRIFNSDVCQKRRWSIYWIIKRFYLMRIHMWKLLWNKMCMKAVSRAFGCLFLTNWYVEEVSGRFLEIIYGKHWILILCISSNVLWILHSLWGLDLE